MSEHSLDSLFERNKNWAVRIRKEHPDFFSSLSEGQHPQLLWIGCSDSRVPANQILDLPPGEIFVHRNIANLVVEGDENCLSVVQYAVDELKVRHIIICGHYGCGGVAASLKGQQSGAINQWLQPIKKMADSNSANLKSLTFNQKHKKLCEINVIQQVANICKTEIVQKAWNRNQELAIHGWIYRLENGRIRKLTSGIESMSEIEGLEAKS